MVFVARQSLECRSQHLVPPINRFTKPIMNDATKHSIFRWIQIVFIIPIIGYVYGPFKELPN
jgi:hypothetical protein